MTSETLPLRRGVLVRIRGLGSAQGAKLNGTLGRCDRFDEQTGRWGVVLPDGSSNALKPENLFSFDEYLKLEHGGIVPLEPSTYLADFATNSKFEALAPEGATLVHKDLPPQELLKETTPGPKTSKKVPLARKASVPLTKQEEASGKYSAVIVKEVELQAGRLRLAIAAPQAQSAERRPLPTILAVSRGEQRHVAKLFRALRAEQRGWQLLVVMRPLSGDRPDCPDLFEPAGTVLLQQLMQAVLDDKDSELTPFGAMSGVFHLAGMSNGGAAVLALAAKAPELTASLSLVTGFVPDFVEVKALRTVSPIYFYVGDSDEMSHLELLRKAREGIKAAGGAVHLHVVKDASHFNIGEHLSLDDFWRRLELAR
ncbi:unnamed protein product [Polarella glacialis]|uniref:Dienelactone hydrolase domain-containing protein n=1 Tax=Polarella glacialis TaxID=89957 RepID=A0A813FF74_POLGL|nr:unnamed protein product [Polarella glacialis]CAE8686246.1 unnamed protein product [Polarella glacialis]|mmetsp:Transcript_15802/g.25225  ORF Transcript_15802/g.25225 Transcript_15802/m.25225 type:complete len:369 (-) Transcript_15802:128-1234(-)